MSTRIQKMDAARSGADAASSVDYATFPNAMPSSREVAPRLGRVYPNGTANQREVYECMRELGYQMGEAEAERVWNATGLIIKDRMPKDGRTYDVGFARFFPALSGTFDSADADFDPARNRLYVAAAPSEEIRNALLDGVPTRSDEMSANDARITNVTWGDGRDANTLKVGEPLDIRGVGLTLGAGGEHAELELPDCTTVQVHLSKPPEDAGIAQRLIGRLTQPVSACEGAVLHLWTHGFDSASALVMVASNKLSVLAGDAPSKPPRITSGHSESHADDGKCYADGSGFVLEGDNLEGAIVTVAGSANEGETWSYEETIPAEKVNFDADMLTIDGNWLDSWYNHLDVGELVKFTVENTDGEDSITRTLSA